MCANIRGGPGDGGPGNGGCLWCGAVGSSGTWALCGVWPKLLGD